MRCRRDQADSWYGVAQLGNVGADLVAGQLTAFSWFRALRHLDLKLISTDQILRRHAEATRCDLLDFRAQRVAGAQRRIDFDSIAAEHARQRRTIFYDA